ncbi:hypothetical protein M947_07130 [Sulfurimonas hongkongensis]|uniref:Lcl C-terminal domain-containing protein n=1 Tax=Sulfurimonas hongkongensis TaxID=1172190 RepID=T0JMC2_9BACT|nr:DUF1566 domain-containing protein [Sulfurimonas hongkongensis]EQB39236.1 hypothetical protein M947_07130 [Sulfurimonas hongkongensis]
MKRLKIFILSLFIACGVNADIVKNSTNTIKDTKTNYLWEDTKEASTTKRTFDDAVNYCKNLELDGHKSWELPGFVELFSIVDTKVYNPTISENFKYVVSENYWSAKTFGHATTKEAFVVNFLSGAFNREKMDKTFYVRCYKKGS